MSVKGAQLRVLAALAVLLLGAASCGGGGTDRDIPPARYDELSLDLVDLEEGVNVFPGGFLKYRFTYRGDLARNLEFTAVFTHEETGESVTNRSSEAPQDSGTFLLTRQLRLDHPFLLQRGRIRLQLFASLVSTKKGSTPWEVQSQSVYLELYPSLELVEVTAAGSGGSVHPLTYGEALNVKVAGKDLWTPVALDVIRADTGELLDLEASLPFDAGQPELGQEWTLLTPLLEKVGTHPLQIRARYGAFELLSQPFEVHVAYTLDAVSVLLRDADDNPVISQTGILRLDAVKQIGIRIAGTNLQGHSLRINGGIPLVASSDVMDLMLVQPEADDFGGGEGRHKYEFTVRSGPFVRQGSAVLERWGLVGCSWKRVDGTEVAEGSSVSEGTQLVLSLDTWGFPDTTTTALLFKSPMAEFTVWEADPGGRKTDILLDATVNNDDEGDSSDEEVHGNHSEARWTAIYEDEFEPLDPLGFSTNAAEYYFEVHLHDVVCISKQILVW